MRNYLHVNAVPVALDRAAVRVVMQSPEVAKKLPFTASDGTVVGVVGSGRPFIGYVGDKLTLGLRGPGCPDAYRQESVTGTVPDAAQAARSTRLAVKELRVALREDAIETRAAFHRLVAGIPTASFGCGGV